MMLITCPVCGPRDEPEFHFAGEPVARPASSVSDREWGDYLFVKSNEKGRHAELWCHAHGCAQWFVMERDTVTHAVLATRPCGVPA